MRSHDLPKKVDFEGKTYKLNWNSNANMDGFEAFFKSDFEFESEEEAEDFADFADINYDSNEDIFVDMWQNGTVRLTAKVF